MEGVSLTDLCPRCERNRFTPYALPERPSREQIEAYPFPALSRVTDVYICTPCGTDEAMRDFTGAGPIPPDEWPIS